MNTTVCDKCGAVLEIADFPFCPHGKGRNNVIGDEIDHVQFNGLKIPHRFTSREERKKYLKAHGWREKDTEARPDDISGYSSAKQRQLPTRAAIMDPQTLANATALVSRDCSPGWRDPDKAPIGITSEEGLIRYMRDLRHADHNEFDFRGR